MLIPYMGMPIIDNADLEDIFPGVRRSGQMVVPVRVRAARRAVGDGIPVNPLAVLRPMELDELIAREAIRDLVARYNAGADGGRFDEVVALFAPTR